MADHIREMTYREAALEALGVQDAVNLSGVVHSFDKVVTAVWTEARNSGNESTVWVNTNPIITMFIAKLLDLNKDRATTPDAYFKDYDAVHRIASGGGR